MGSYNTEIALLSPLPTSRECIQGPEWGTGVCSSAGSSTQPGKGMRSFRGGGREGRGLGLPSHRGILMSVLARSGGAGGDHVMKTDDPAPALLIFLLEDQESQPGGGGAGEGLPSAWVRSALAPSCSLLPTTTPHLTPPVRPQFSSSCLHSLFPVSPFACLCGSAF